MFTISLGTIVALIAGYAVWIPVGSIVLSISVGVLVLVGCNILVSRRFYKMITALMETVEKDIRSERIDAALDKLKAVYKYQHWQLFLKKQLDAQVGSLLYARKRFDEALPYMQNAFVKNWMTMCMLASHYYRQKDYDNALKTMEKTTKSNKKEAFPYSLYAYMLVEQNQQAKAIETLTKGTEKIPLDERLQNELDAVRNNKKIKIQNYGALWMQMHLDKVPDGGKQYQALLMNQRFKRK
ncbi:MAG: hypothetical protein LBV04_03335 [Deferribacteraceae bacterium]|jgi:tetratricopeptide (TPR) repeat protein|nr:hypothetical protein [Deferribacteraceae bacterium]